MISFFRFWFAYVTVLVAFHSHFANSLMVSPRRTGGFDIVSHSSETEVLRSQHLSL